MRRNASQRYSVCIGVQFQRGKRAEPHSYLGIHDGLAHWYLYDSQPLYITSIFARYLNVAAARLSHRRPWRRGVAVPPRLAPVRQRWEGGGPSMAYSDQMHKTSNELRALACCRPRQR